MRPKWTGSVAPSDGYQRPSDWLTLPPVVETEDKIAGLHAIFLYSNFLAFTVETEIQAFDFERTYNEGEVVKEDGEYYISLVDDNLGNTPPDEDFWTIHIPASIGYTVNWGDGLTEDFDSGATAEHIYDYSTVSDSTLCSRGYKQVIVVITPQTGQRFTGVDLGVKYSGINTGYTSGFLDIKMSGSEIKTFSMGAGYIYFTLCEQFDFIGSNKMTYFASIFYFFNNLQSVPNLYTGFGEDFGYMFGWYCSYIKSIDTSSGTYFESMYSRNISPLQTEVHPISGSCSYMFSYNYIISKIPAFDMSTVTSAADFARDCINLVWSDVTGTKVSISYANCKLSREAIVHIFNNLEDVALDPQTIDITGNWGVPYLTAADLLIATNKSYTVLT